MTNLTNDNSSPPIRTETMAKLLLGQRHWRQAIDMYKELSRQNPAKAEAYEQEISQIKEYFKPQVSPERVKNRARTRKKIARLENLLKAVEKK